MKRISEQEALEIAYRRLYEGELGKIDKNLDALIKAKKLLIRSNKSKKL